MSAEQRARGLTPEEVRELVCKRTIGAHGYASWKGTDACLSLRCDCGGSSHIDSDFLYYVRCPFCARVWALDPVIRLIAVHEPASWPSDQCEPRTARPNRLR